jgi:hypothetical protein
VKGFEADAQQFCCASLVVFGLLQRSHDHLTFNFLEWRSNWKCQRVLVAESLALLNWVWRKVMTFDLFAGTNDYGTLDYIP